MAEDGSDYVYSIVEANEALTSSFEKLNGKIIENIDKSKAWTLVRRLTAGSGFWEIQNRLKAVTMAMVMYNNTQKKTIERNKEQIDSMQKFAKAVKSMPSDSFSFFAKPGDTREERKEQKKHMGKKSEYKAMENMNFQMRKNKLRYKFGDGEGRAQKAAELETQTFFEKDLKLNRERMKNQLWMMQQQRTYQIPIYGRLVQMKDRIVTTFKLMPKFLWGGIKAIGAMLKGVMWAVILLPIVFKVIHWLLKMSKNVNPKTMENLRVAWDFIREAMSHVGDLVSAIVAGKWKAAIGIYFKKILPPIIKAGLMLIFIAIDKIKKAILWVWDNRGMIKTELEKFAKLVGEEVKEAAGKAASWFNIFNKDSGIRNLGVATSASGNRFPNGGMTWVGEGGPELLSLPKGARVHSNFESRGMGGNTINVHVNGRVGASDTEIQDIAKKVSYHINREMNRTHATVARF